MSFMPKPLHCIILGAVGRDFHDFQMFFRERADFQVVAFRAAQIPFIENRSFPKGFAGSLYNADIPIFPEHKLPSLISRFEVDLVFLAYSPPACGGAA
jgi:predicted GTPase